MSSLPEKGEGDGGVEGRSERSAGGGAGPIRRLFEAESVDELLDLSGDCGDGDVSVVRSSRLRFESR